MALIPYDDRDGFIYMDGQMLPWREAKIHVLTHALHYASCVFEGERAYNGKIFKSRQHSERLVNSAQILGMDMPMSVDEIEAVKLEVMKANNVLDGYMRVVAWRGAEQMGISAQATKTHIAFCTWEWPSYFSPEKRENGIKLKTAPWKRPAPDTAPTSAKAAGLYMICTISKHAVEKEGYDDALMLDYRGFVAEATGANIFLIKDGEVHTPPADCFLNGITRQTLMELCREHGIMLHERHIKPEELSSFQECFLTGTAAEVTAVGSIDHHNFTVGPTVRKLREAYEALVRR